MNVNKTNSNVTIGDINGALMSLSEMVGNPDRAAELEDAVMAVISRVLPRVRESYRIEFEIKAALEAMTREFTPIASELIAKGNTDVRKVLSMSGDYALHAAVYSGKINGERSIAVCFTQAPISPSHRSTKDMNLSVYKKFKLTSRGKKADPREVPNPILLNHIIHKMLIRRLAHYNAVDFSASPGNYSRSFGYGIISGTTNARITINVSGLVYKPVFWRPTAW